MPEDPDGITLLTLDLEGITKIKRAEVFLYALPEEMPLELPSKEDLEIDALQDLFLKEVWGLVVIPDLFLKEIWEIVVIPELFLKEDWEIVVIQDLLLKEDSELALLLDLRAEQIWEEILQCLVAYLDLASELVLQLLRGQELEEALLEESEETELPPELSQDVLSPIPRALAQDLH